MNITYKFIAYLGSVFADENSQGVEFKDIKDNFYLLNGRKGKIYHKGYTSVHEQGYSGGYDSFGFVYQDDLTMVDLDRGEKILLEYCQ